MIKINWSKTNVKSSATGCERKIPGGLHKNHEGVMGNWAHMDGKKSLFQNSTIGKTKQDYGSNRTQVIK